MPKTIEIPGVGEVEFPDTMTDRRIELAASRLHQQAVKGTQLRQELAAEREPSLGSRVVATMGAYDENRPLLPPSILKAGMQANPGQMALRAIAPEFTENLQDVVATGAAGATAPAALPYLPAFSIPVVRELLLAKMGTAGLMEAAGTGSVALQQQSPALAGQAVGQAGLGASMFIPGVKGSPRAVQQVRDISSFIRNPPRLEIGKDVALRQAADAVALKATLPPGTPPPLPVSPAVPLTPTPGVLDASLRQRKPETLPLGNPPQASQGVGPQISPEGTPAGIRPSLGAQVQAPSPQVAVVPPVELAKPSRAATAPIPLPAAPDLATGQPAGAAPPPSVTPALPPAAPAAPAAPEAPVSLLPANKKVTIKARHGTTGEEGTLPMKAREAEAFLNGRLDLYRKLLDCLSL